MEGEESRVFRSGNRTRGDQDGRGEDEGCFGLADSERSQGHTKVFGIGKLLLLIH